jgi:hypothetical protein
MKRVPLEERFWKMVDIRGPDECWPWLGTRHKGKFQYGTVHVRIGDKTTMKPAHRVAYDLTYGPTRGPIPDDLLACHTCDNPPCCNPYHVFPGTDADNTADMLNKGRRPSQKGKRMRPDQINRGEKHGLARLTTEQVLEIRAATTTSGKELARRYAVSEDTISKIRHRKVWKHV